MKSDDVEQGPTGRRVAANVRELRKARGLDLKDLAGRMNVLGQPISLNGLSRVENGKRRVDVDDVVALALALDVAPNRVLLTAEADEQEVELAPAQEAKARADQAWAWACGNEPLPLSWDDEGLTIFDPDRYRRFILENAPHDPPDQTSMSELRKHQDELLPVVDAVQTAQAAGLPLQAIISFIEMTLVFRRPVEKIVAEASPGDVRAES